MNCIDGVILAGGRSSRMEGQNKAECLIAGRPMLDWVIQTAQPQLRLLAINRPKTASFPTRDLPTIPDRVGGFHGPLMGLYSAMDWFVAEHRSEWLALFACDTPFVPRDLVARLYAAAQARQALAAVVSLAGKAQPTASLWHCDLLPRLREAVVEHHQAGFKTFLDEIEAAFLPLDESWSDSFLNVNTPADLERARAIVGQRSPESLSC